MQAGLTDDALTGRLIVYHRVKTAAGNWKLMRRKDGKDEPLPGAYSRVRFDLVNATGGPFVRVTLHVLARDLAAVGDRGASEEAVLTSLVRAAPAEMLGSPLFDWTFLDGITSVKPLEGDLGF